MTASGFAGPLKPPFHVVTFTSRRREGDGGYNAMAEHMVALATEQLGFLGVESARDADGFGITNSYWADEASILAWRAHAEHMIARQRGRTDWYEHYEVRIAKVERAYAMGHSDHGHGILKQD